MPSLKVELNKVYLDEKKNMVTIVRQFVETDADYVQGFRFRGDNGTNYRDNGGVYGQVGQATIMQLGAVPLVSLYTGDGTTSIIVEAGKLYRNTIGGLVMIVGEVVPHTKWWDKGYRFVDHRGSVYAEHGMIISKVFGCLSLVEPVNLQDVSVEELTIMEKQTRRFIQRKVITNKIKKFCNRAVPFAITVKALIAIHYLGQFVQRRFGIAA